MVGIDMLRKTSEALYRDVDPLEIFYRGKTHDFTKENGQYVLSFTLPYTKKEEISLIKNNGELIVQVGAYRRNIHLPKTVVGLAVIGANLEDRKLIIRFAANNGLYKKGSSKQKRRSGNG